MRGPFHDPHRGETRELRLARRSRKIETPMGRLAHLGVHPLARYEARAFDKPAAPVLEPVSLETGNDLRPMTLADMIGQDALKPLFRRLIDNAARLERPLDHLLLIGASGTGKTTLAMILARELDTRCFVLKAPIDMGTLEALRECAQDRDVVFVDEIHQQVHGDRRGITQAVDTESLYHVLEDRILMTPRGPLPFPHTTWIGATTDAGLLPEALVNRFPIQPRLAPYTLSQMAEIGRRNLQSLHMTGETGVPELFASACRLNPRQLNSYVRAASALGGDHIDAQTAHDVVVNLAGTTMDGLTTPMQTALRFLYRHCRRESKQGVTYSASVNTLATATGHGRDTKYISLMVEPWLLQVGLLEVRPTGRTLTDEGIQRAKELCDA